MTYETKALTAISALIIDEFGYKKDFNGNNPNSTKNYVRIMYNSVFGGNGNLGFNDKAIFEKFLKPLLNKSFEYTKKAEDILNWIRNKELVKFNTPGDVFLAKLKRAAMKDEIFENELGYIACLPNAYNKENKFINVTPAVEPQKSEEQPKEIESEEPQDKIDIPKEEPQVNQTNNETVTIDGLTLGLKNDFVPTVSWIKKYFKICNEKYWNGALPTPNFGICKAKYEGGHVRARGAFNRRTGRVESLDSMELKLSVYLIHSEKHTLEILIHEMIHVYQNGILRVIGDHDRTFIPEKRRLDKFGWDIPIVETEELQKMASVNSDVTNSFAKNNYMAVLQKRDGRYGFCFFSKKQLPKFKDIAEQYVSKEYSLGIEFFEIKNGERFHKYSVNRNDFRHYSTTLKDIKEMEHNGDIKSTGIFVTSKQTRSILDESKLFESIYDSVEVDDEKSVKAWVGDTKILDYNVHADTVDFDMEIV